MTMVAEYTPQEIAQFGLKIPTDAEIEEMLEDLNRHQPVCGDSSQNEVNPNAFCVCSRQATVSQLGCTIC